MSSYTLAAIVDGQLRALPNGGSATDAGGNPIASAGTVTRSSPAGQSGELAVSAGANDAITSFTTNGIVKIASGVVAAATAETDYVTPSGSGALTNKTINASLNTISNLTTAMFASNVIDTDGTLAANSDTRVASQKAVKTYVDNAIVTSSLVNLKGNTDASGNPNYPAAVKGDAYLVTVSGKIGGASGLNVYAGDLVVCNVANAGGTQAAVGADFFILQYELLPSSTTVAGFVRLATTTEATTRTDATIAVTPAGLATFVNTADTSSVDATIVVQDGTTGLKYKKTSTALADLRRRVSFDVPLVLDGQNQLTSALIMDITMPYAGYLVASSIKLSNARTAGTLTASTQINGSATSATGLQLAIGASPTTKANAVVAYNANASYAVSVGDTAGFLVTTSSFGPLDNQATLALIVELT